MNTGSDFQKHREKESDSLGLPFLFFGLKCGSIPFQPLTFYHFSHINCDFNVKLLGTYENI